MQTKHILWDCEFHGEILERCRQCIQKKILLHYCCRCAGFDGGATAADAAHFHHMHVSHTFYIFMAF